MSVEVLSVVVIAWIALGLGTGWVMGRRGHETFPWTVIGLMLGPVAALGAAIQLRIPPTDEPRVYDPGPPRPAGVDVLVGADGSPEARAVMETVEDLLGANVGRLTLARVVPLDAGHALQRTAWKELRADREKVGAGASATLLRGNPAAALREHAVADGYQLLAIGTRGAGRTRAVMGSVASTLARGSTVPVLLADAAARERSDTNGVRG